jgi:DNA-binding response OmpR family regulator
MLLKAIKRGLAEEGFTVDIDCDGHDGNTKVPAAWYDAIIVDLLRPGAAACSVVQRWRRAGLKARVLALTPPGKLTDSEILVAGVDEWLTKPFDLDELLVRVQLLIRGR